jgi:small conductance mechanosensitive channel
MQLLYLAANETSSLSPLERMERIFFILGILFLTIMAAWIFRHFYSRFIKKATAIMHNDPTSYKFLLHAGTAIIYIIGISWAIYETHALRTVAKSLLAGAGVLALAVGLASQQALANIVSGIFIIIFKPFRVNQRIKIRDTLHGIVEDITLRHVVIRDFENRRIIIPNTVISQEIVINADIEDIRICKWVEINVALDTDLDVAKSLLAIEIENHKYFIDNRTPEMAAEGLPLVPVRVLSIGDFFIRLRAWAWANNSAEAFELQTDVLESIIKKYRANGIKLSVPHHKIELTKGDMDVSVEWGS